MMTELVVMLTWHDVTVPDAKKIFIEAKDAPAMHWGFKNIGLPIEEMKELTDVMKEAGKKTYLEVINPDPEASIYNAKLCAECGIDVLLGTKFTLDARKVTEEAGVQYFPFVGDLVNGRIEGNMEELIEEAIELEKEGVDGLNLSIFRYPGDGKLLLKNLKREVSVPFCVPGSVHTTEQIQFLKEEKVSKFTIGGAFFENKFGQTFAEGIKAVDKILSQ